MRMTVFLFVYNQQVRHRLLNWPSLFVGEPTNPDPEKRSFEELKQQLLAKMMGMNQDFQKLVQSEAVTDTQGNLSNQDSEPQCDEKENSKTCATVDYS
jgi:hypothetical protein